MPPSTGMLRMIWPRSAGDGDSMPTGQICLTAPLSMPRSSTSASAARPINSVGDASSERGVVAHARVAEIAIGEARRAQEEHLEKPVEDDRDLAEEEACRALFGATKMIVQHQQRQRQHGRDAQDVERVRQRDEPPFRRGQIEDVADDDAERDEIGQDAQQQRQAIARTRRLRNADRSSTNSAAAVASASCVAISTLRKVRFGNASCRRPETGIFGVPPQGR